MSGTCAIWGTPAQTMVGVEPYPGPTIVSARAGGSYRLSGPLNIEMCSISIRQKLTTWLVDQRRAGNLSPIITAETLNQVQLQATASISKRLERALLFLELASPRVGMVAHFWGIVSEQSQSNLELLQAWTESQDSNEAAAVITLLQDRGEVVQSRDGAKLTAKGWDTIEKLRIAPGETATAFVAMWFSKEVTAAYENGIAPGIRDAGWLPVRIDQKEHSNKIDDEIIAEIRRARFIVADFTSEPDKPRGGVYFEAGFAMGLNKPVIWTCRSDMIENVHFDTRQFNHITWSAPADLRTKLKARIGAVIGDGPGVSAALNVRDTMA